MKRILITALTLLSVSSIASAGQAYDVKDNTTTMKAIERLVGEFRIMIGTKATDGWNLQFSSNGAITSSSTIKGATITATWNVYSQNITTMTQAISDLSVSTYNIFTALNSTAVALSQITISTTIIFNQESPDISNRTYYLHDISTGAASRYRLLGSTPSNATEASRTINTPLASNLVLISSHITAFNDPGVRKVPAGVWSFTSWVGAASLLNNAQLVITVSTVNIAGTESEILSSTSTSILDTNSERFDMVAVQANDMAVSTGDRFLVKYYARSTSAVGINVTLYYAGTTRFSHLSTPIGAVYKFTQLSDAPSTFVGKAGKYLAVNDDETTLVLISSTSASASVVRPYTVVIGSVGAPGADFTAADDTALRSAVQSITGIQNATTGYGSILQLPGTFNFSGATVPYGLKVYTMDPSSTIWQLTSSSVELINCYGWVDGITFSFGNLGWLSQGIAIKQNCRITNATVIGSTCQANADPVNTNNAGAIFSATAVTSNTFVQAYINGYRVKPHNTLPWAGPVKIENARNTRWQLTFDNGIFVTNGAAIWIKGSSDTYITDGWFKDVGGDFLSIRENNRRTYIQRNLWDITSDGDGNGYLHYTFVSSNFHSSMTVISDNIVNWRHTGATNNWFNNASNPADGLLIENNRITGGGLAGTSPLAIFAIAGISTTNAILKGNSVFDTSTSSVTFISDSGTATQFRNLGNFKNGVQQ